MLSKVGWLNRFLMAHQHHLGYLVPLLATNRTLTVTTVLSVTVVWSGITGHVWQWKGRLWVTGTATHFKCSVSDKILGVGSLNGEGYFCGRKQEESAWTKTNGSYLILSMTLSKVKKRCCSKIVRGWLDLDSSRIQSEWVVSYCHISTIRLYIAIPHPTGHTGPHSNAIHVRQETPPLLPLRWTPSFVRGRQKENIH